jgi:hypothetical protein
MAMAAGASPSRGGNGVVDAAPPGIAPPADPFSEGSLQFLADAIRLEGRSEVESMAAAGELARCVYGSTLDLTHPPRIHLTEPVMHALVAWAITHNGIQLCNARIDLSGSKASHLIKSLSFINGSITGIDFCHLAGSAREQHLDLRPFEGLTLTGTFLCNGSIKARPDVRVLCRVGDAAVLQVETSKWIERYRAGEFSREDKRSVPAKSSWVDKLSVLCSPSLDRGPVPDGKRPVEGPERDAPAPVAPFKAGQRLGYHDQTLQVLRVHGAWADIECDTPVPPPLGRMCTGDGHGRYSYFVRVDELAALTKIV